MLDGRIAMTTGGTVNYVEDDEEIRDVADLKDEALAAPAVEPAVPLKPWEHYTLADEYLRQARAVAAQADTAGKRVTEQMRSDPLGAYIDHAAGGGLGNYGVARMKRALWLAELAQAHSAQAAAGALLQQHYGVRFTELWSPGNGMTKAQRDAELDAFPGSATTPGRPIRDNPQA